MEPFRRWSDLNGTLMDTTDEAFIRSMLEIELARDPPCKMFVKRISCRISKVRRLRECAEIERRMK